MIASSALAAFPPDFVPPNGCTITGTNMSCTIESGYGGRTYTDREVWNFIVSCTGAVKNSIHGGMPCPNYNPNYVSTTPADSCWTSVTPNDTTCKYQGVSKNGDPRWICGSSNQTSTVQTSQCSQRIYTADRQIIWECSNTADKVNIYVRPDTAGYPVCNNKYAKAGTSSVSPSIQKSTQFSPTNSPQPKTTTEIIEVENFQVDSPSATEATLETISSQIADLKKAQTRNEIGLIILLIAILGMSGYLYVSRK